MARVRVYRILPVSALLLCVLVVWPVVESGMLDDFSTVRTAQLLASTGHVIYNGWEAPMLGWLLYAGAAAIRIFGFSYTILRLVDVAISLVAVVVLQDILLRLGITARNAAFATLAFAVSPIIVMCSTVYMTDMPGALAILVSLYGVVRARQAETDLRAVGWLAFATIGNSVLGTVRQTSWLGVLLVVPVSLWLFRARRRVFVSGIFLCVAGWIGVGLSLRWFDRQPFVLAEHLFIEAPVRHHNVLLGLIGISGRFALDSVLMLLPLGLVFLNHLSQLDQRIRKRATACLLFAFVLPWLIAPALKHGNYLAPFLMYGSTLSADQLVTSFPSPALGPPALLIGAVPRIIATMILFAALVAIAFTVVPNKRGKTPERTPINLIGWKELALLTLPFAVVYFALLLPRGLTMFTVDRYTLPMLPVLVLWLAWLYQVRIGDHMPGWMAIPLVVTAVISSAAMHDDFALHRATLRAIKEVRSAGIPREAISGGLEYDFTTQILDVGYPIFGGIRMPGGWVQSNPVLRPGPRCSPPGAENHPVVRARFGVGTESLRCTHASFAPVPYTALMPPFRRTLYVVELNR